MKPGKGRRRCDRRKFNRRNQAKWIEKISAWAEEETNSYQLPESLEKFSQRFLEDRTNAGGETPRPPLVEALAPLRAVPVAIRDLVLTRASAEIRERVARANRRRGVVGRDDMFSRLDSALRLRLLLGLGGSAAFPRPLTVEELLVVTFTEAATAELRGRIRSNIHELRIACLREPTDNPLYKRLLEEIDDKALAAQWLRSAKQ